MATGQDAVAEVTTGVPRRKKAQASHPGAPTFETDLRVDRDLVTTNIQIRREQLHLVQDAAMKRARERGTARANHSEIYREAIDLWFEKAGA